MAAPKQIALRKTGFRYPSEKECEKMVVSIVDYELHQQTPDFVKEATHKLAAALDAAWPHFMVYETYIREFEIGDEYLEKHMDFFSRMPEGIKNKFRKMLAKVNAANADQIKHMGLFLKHQQDIMNSQWTEGQLEAIAEIQEDLGL